MEQCIASPLCKKKLRSRSEPNEIEIKENYANVSLYNIRGKVVAKVKIDLKLIKRISKHKWYLRNGYAYNDSVGKLHNFIMRAENGQWYDHINTKSLDCRKDNLRPCTVQENNRNKSMSSNNTSGAKGVTIGKRGYLAYITVDNKKIGIGKFNNLISAAKAYNRSAKAYFGEFAKRNNIKKLRLKLESGEIVQPLFSKPKNRSKTGVPGISIFRDRYKVEISISGKQKYIGCAKTLEEAVLMQDKSKGELK